MYGRYTSVGELTGGDAGGGDEQRYELCAALIFSNGLSGHTSYYGLPGSGGLPRWCRRLVLGADTGGRGRIPLFQAQSSEDRSEAAAAVLVFYDMKK